jgi:hypothetical protein
MEDFDYIPFPPPPAPPVPGTQATQERPSAPSLMDLLRQRVERNIANEPMQRLTDLGAGMLANPNRNFFTMLGGGLRAQSEGERSRMQELRQVADAERQAAQQQAEEAYRREQNRINEERYRDQAPYRAAQAQQAAAMAEYYRQGGSGAGRGGAAPRGTVLTPAAYNDIQRRAAAQALREFPNPSSSEAVLMPPAERADREARRVARERQLIAEGVNAYTLSTPGALAASVPVAQAPAPPSAPAAQIDARGNPIR